MKKLLKSSGRPLWRSASGILATRGMPGRLNPVFAHLAINRAWAEVFARLDRGEAGVSDFDSVRALPVD